MVIVFDMDGVLLDLHTSLEKKLKIEYPNFTMNNVLTYDFNKSLDLSLFPFDNGLRKNNLGLYASYDEIIKCLNNPDIYKEALVYKNVCLLLETLSKKGHTIYITTKTMDFNVAKYKTEQLNQLFGGLKNVSIIVTLGKNKSIIADADIVIEDNPFELERYLSLNVNRYLINKSYNQVQYNRNLEDVFDNSTRVNTTFDAINDFFGNDYFGHLRH